MSKPRYYWFGIIKKTIYQYPDKLDMNTRKGVEAELCIRKALSETEKLRFGKDRIKLIELVFIRESHKTFAAAAEIHISESTAKRWISDFVYLVARQMGYL